MGINLSGEMEGKFCSFTKSLQLYLMLYINFYIAYVTISPMDKNLYKIDKLDADSFRVVLSGKNHPIFKAHFPNNPILPGFIFLHICEKALGHKINNVIRAKFISFAKPNDILTMLYVQKGDYFQITFTRGCQKICVLNYKTARSEI